MRVAEYYYQGERILSYIEYLKCYLVDLCAPVSCAEITFLTPKPIPNWLFKLKYSDPHTTLLCYFHSIYCSYPHPYHCFLTYYTYIFQVHSVYSYLCVI